MRGQAIRKTQRREVEKMAVVSDTRDTLFLVRKYNGLA